MPITAEEKAAILEMIANELIPAINNMLIRKKLPYNVHGAHQEGNELFIYLASTKHQVELVLRQDWLMEKYYCSKVDRLGGFGQITNIVTKVKLRILRCVFNVLKAVELLAYPWVRYEFAGTDGTLYMRDFRS